MTSRTPKQEREALLVAVYHQVGGSTSVFFETAVAGEHVGLDKGRADEHMTVLSQGGLVDHLTFGGSGSLTARGVREAERLIEQLEEPAETDSAILLTIVERQAVEALVGALERAELDTQLEGDDLLEYQADLETARAQARSPRPKRGAVRAIAVGLLKTAGAFGVSIAANVATTLGGL